MFDVAGCQVIACDNEFLGESYKIHAPAQCFQSSRDDKARKLFELCISGLWYAL